MAEAEGETLWELRDELERVRQKVEAKKREEATNGGARYSRAYGRVAVRSILGASEKDLCSWIGKEISVGGWVRNGRLAERNAKVFVELNDGSILHSLQCIATSDVCDPESLKPMGTCLVLRGLLRQPTGGAKQRIELHVSEVLFRGGCNASEYPLALKKTSVEFLRDNLHLRARTNTIGSIQRIRNCISFASHSFFQQNGFLYLHTPLITQSDCEGAGEMFQVTTLLSHAEHRTQEPVPDLEKLAADVEAHGSHVRSLKEQNAPKEQIDEGVRQLKEAKAAKEAGEHTSKRVGGIARKQDGSTIDYSEDFFEGPSFLTVSGQLQGEIYACGMTAVYTFGPTFRAENSNTTRHLAEFWMIEPEIAFADNNDNMQCAEDFVRYCCSALLRECSADLEFLASQYDANCLERVRLCADNTFGRCSYTEAVEIVQNAAASGTKFEYPLEWGNDFATEHERYLAETHFKKPVIVYDYPKDIKAFYMRQNEDGQTVRAMDVLAPKVGELAGGSQREEDIGKLEERCKALNLDMSEYKGYLDLRRFGTCVHSGFGVGLERLVLFASGMENIRDVIPFPRWPGNCPG